MLFPRNFHSLSSLNVPQLMCEVAVENDCVLIIFQVTMLFHIFIGIRMAHKLSLKRELPSFYYQTKYIHTHKHTLPFIQLKFRQIDMSLLRIASLGLTRTSTEPPPLHNTTPLYVHIKLATHSPKVCCDMFLGLFSMV